MSNNNSNDKREPMLTTIMPLLVVSNAAVAIEFYMKAFGATEVERYEMGDGKLGAKLSIDGAEFCVGDEEPEFNNLCPERIGGSPVRLVLTVDDPDTVFNRALGAGATQVCPVTTEETWRIGKLTDPYGHIWEIGHQLAE